MTTTLDPRTDDGSGGPVDGSASVPDAGPAGSAAKHGRRRRGALRRPAWLELPDYLTPRPAPAQDVPAPARALIRSLLVLAGLAIWLVVFGLVLSGLAESHAQSGLYTRLRGELAGGVAPLNDAVPPGTPLAVLSAPRAQLHGLVVVQGVSSSVLRDGPGHLPGSPLPGQPGVPLIMGRSTSFGAPFGHLTDLRVGDPITATTGQGTFTYVVEDVRRPGDPFPPLLKPGGSQLTLVTGEGGGWRSGWAPTHAVYVDALLTGKAVAAGTATGLRSATDAVMTSDPSGLYPLVLWLQLLVVSVIAGLWARSRWGIWQTWLVAAPVAGLALWGASTEAWLLLPNLL